MQGSTEMIEKQVVEIMPDAKYVILVPERVPMREMEYMRERIEQWQKSGDQFLILGGGLTLKRIDE